MNLAKTTAALLVVLGAWLAVPAQVLTPMELAYPETQNLQRRHLETLMAIGTEIEAHKFPYPFYFSRVLDVEISKMQVADQRSIRFDIYMGQTVLEITAELLFEVFSQRYERGSTMVTSNLPFQKWTEVLGSERLTGALLDRLTHHVHILEMNGESYRLKQSKRKRVAQGRS